MSTRVGYALPILKQWNINNARNFWTVSIDRKVIFGIHTLLNNFSKDNGRYNCHF